jgi:multicomponent Na+:H+ antiporter subunit G
VSPVDWASGALALAGAFFFLAGTLALLRFPDALNRLHGLTKADNVGLGLVAAAVALQAGSPAVAVKLLGLWLLTLATSALACHLIGDATLATGAPGSRRDG